MRAGSIGFSKPASPRHRRGRPRPGAACSGLTWLNFLVAAMQMGFGPFLSVYLTAHFWNPEAIGVAFSVGTAAAIAAQVPGGAAADAIPSKPLAAGMAVLAISIAAAAIA